jgi:hypothetical protein
MALPDRFQTDQVWVFLCIGFENAGEFFITMEPIEFHGLHESSLLNNTTRKRPQPGFSVSVPLLPIALF